MYTIELDMILTRFARKLTRRHDVADLVQTTYLKMYQNKEKLQDRNLGIWGCVVLRNEFINECRANKKHTDEPLEVAVKIKSNYTPEDYVNLKYLEQQVNKLPTRLKGIFVDRFTGLSYNELSDKYNSPLNSIKSYLYRARQILMKTV